MNLAASSPRRPIRVLAVDHTAGIIPFRKKFAALAARPEIELTVLAPDRWVENFRAVRASPGEERGFEIRTGRTVWPGYENRAFFYTGLGPAIRRARPDILHLWEEPFSLLTLQALAHAAIWAPRAKALFFSSDNLSRDFHYAYRPSALYARVERFAHRRCAGGTAVSLDVAEVLREKGFAKPLEVIPLGLDLADYLSEQGQSSGEIGRRALKVDVAARFGFSPPIVAFAGRLLHQKGVDLLLRAAARMDRVWPSLVIVGEGPERGPLERLAAELGIGARTRFLPLVPHAEMPALLAAVDVLVLPSRTTPRLKEQFGRVLIEGMAAGCVVIGSSSGAIPEVLGDAGLIFPEEDSAALAITLERALGDSALRESLRAAGRQRVRDRYTWEVITKRIVDFYRRLLNA